MVTWQRLSSLGSRRVISVTALGRSSPPFPIYLLPGRPLFLLPGQRSWSILIGAIPNIAFTAFSEVQHSRVPLPGALGTGRGLFSARCTLMFVEICKKDIHDRAYLSIGVTSSSGAGLCRVPEAGVFRGGGVRLCTILDMNF